ncbi:hypothetical protein HDF14_000318 [Edaphobacter lichenicola]|jgi:hypothetical protein|uniref:Uncharacterized protein n=1 Tax=Tunturiibacter gelidiferens TaxID=3069689 RepID=A0A9X0U1T0_9BACT|nr:hypothetical protein [Edaphobacter lichenicola]
MQLFRSKRNLRVLVLTLGGEPVQIPLCLGRNYTKECDPQKERLQNISSISFSCTLFFGNESDLCCDYVGHYAAAGFMP